MSHIALAETVLTNATVVLPQHAIAATVVIRGGLIADIQPGSAAGCDLDGDYLLPGCVDVHTDNLERQVMPRSNARWPSRAALLAHDAQCAASGITTVFDALCAGQAGLDDDRTRTCREGVADLAALASSGLLKAHHQLHLRCELPAPDLLAQLEIYAAHPALRMVSLMDHTPGFGQFGDLARYRRMLRQDGLDHAAIDEQIAGRWRQRAQHLGPNRRGLLDRLRDVGAVLASHDDATDDDVAANLADGIMISEFPVSLHAAEAAKAAGMSVIAGAPNLVRGGSHSGNVAVADLLRAGVVDVLASDYVPGSMVHAAFIAAEAVGLPAAFALVSSAPARMTGLADRGEVAVGKRADLVRVRVHEGVPVVRQVWLAGERVI